MRPDVGTRGGEDGVHNCGTGGTGDAVVVGFADAAEGGDVCFDEEVLGEIWGMVLDGIKRLCEY